MREGYKYQWPPNRFRKRRKREPEVQRDVVVDVPGLGECVLMSPHALRKWRKRQREGGGGA